MVSAFDQVEQPAAQLAVFALSASDAVAMAPNQFFPIRSRPVTAAAPDDKREPEAQRSAFERTRRMRRAGALRRAGRGCGGHRGDAAGAVAGVRIAARFEGLRVPEIPLVVKGCRLWARSRASEGGPCEAGRRGRGVAGRLKRSAKRCAGRIMRVRENAGGRCERRRPRNVAPRGVAPKSDRGLDRRDPEGECSECRHRDRAGRLHHGHSPFFSSMRSVNLRNPTGKARRRASDSAELFVSLPIRNRSGCRSAPTIDTCGIRSGSAHTGVAMCAPPCSLWRSP
jgi:hypothetical protein